jgi:anaerobic magnesium-protoporphyrin IX monomethyl ester cyclase
MHFLLQPENNDNMKQKDINKKILLIQPNYREARKTGVWGITPPLGLAYIAAVLEQNNIRVEILDANVLDLTEREVAERAKNYDVVGISLLTPAYNFGVKLARMLPKNVLKVVGGPHVAGWAEQSLNEGFDIVVRGEGEQSFLDIILEKEMRKIDGISYKRGGKVIHNPTKPLNPNDLPFPARHLLINNGVDLPYFSASSIRNHYSPIFTSRGCPYNCYYCNKNTFGQGFRPRDPKNVVDEIELLVKKYGVKEIDIYDDCFNFDIKRAEKILDMINERKLNIIIRCSNGIRADSVTEGFLKKMKRTGCNYIAIGFESGNQEVLDRIPKHMTLETCRRTARLVKKSGITLCGFFMLGLLGDTKETMQQTIDFAKEIDVDIAQFTIATPYPGTRFYEEVKKNGKFLVNDFDLFHHTVGSVSFTHPDVASPKEVEDAYVRAHKEFYFRPNYIFKQVLKHPSLSYLKIMWRGGRTILKIQLKGLKGS